MKKTLKGTNEKSELLYRHDCSSKLTRIETETVTDQTGHPEAGSGRVSSVFDLQAFLTFIDQLSDRIPYLPFIDNHIHDCILSLK